MCKGHGSPIDPDSLVKGDPPDHRWGCKAHSGSLWQAPSGEPGSLVHAVYLCSGSVGFRTSMGRAWICVGWTVLGPVASSIVLNLCT